MWTESRFLVCLLAVLLLATPAAAKKSGSKYDGKADFSKYTTFKWVDNPKPRGPRVEPGADLDVLIRGLVTQRLVSQGLEEKEGEADLSVTYDAVAVPVTNLEAMRQEITPGVAWVVDGPLTAYLEGNLVITISDTGTDKPVWTAWTSVKVHEPDNPNKQVEVDRKVTKAVKKLMARYPPKK